MKARRLGYFLVTPLLAVLTLGCHAVYVNEPVGPPAVELKPEDWAGQWRLPGEKENLIEIFVTEPKSGGLTLAGIEAENGIPKLKTIHIFLRPMDENEWLVTAADDDKPTSDPQRMTFAGLMRRSGEVCVLWPARASTFAEWMDAGKMPGKREGDGDARLGKVAPKDLDMITSPALMLLDWKEPGFFERISKK